MDGVTAILLLGGAAGLYLWTLSKAAGNLIYLPGSFTGFEWGLSPEISATLIVQNTSNLSFTINSIAANVLSDGTQVGNVKSFVPTEIPSNSEAAVPIILTMQPIGIVNEIISIMTGGVGGRTVVISGSVNANGLQQAFSVEYKLGT